MRLWLAGLLALLAGCAAPPPALGPQDLAPGLLYAQPGPGLHALKIDLRQRRIALTPHAERGRSLPDFSGAAAALAAVNASFFDREFRVRGHTVSEGEAWPGPLLPEASPLLACDAAQRCRIELQAPQQAPAGTHTALSGTPWLVRQGLPRTPADDAACGAFCVTPHPRTALGLSEDGRSLVLLLVEGRRADRPGLSLADTARRLRELGAHEAINLDGGGSSSLLLRGRAVMLRPANEPALRRVANALLVD